MTTNAAAPDLRSAAPRRWSESIDGIVWLPRLIDKARAYDAGTLGIYMFGQSPVDVTFLRAAAIDHAQLLRIVRGAASDADVLAGIESAAPGAIGRMRAWTTKPPLMCRATFTLIDADEGNASGPARLIRLIPQSVFLILVTVLRRVAPFHPDPR